MENLLKKVIINDTIQLNKNIFNYDIVADVFIYQSSENTYFYMDRLFLAYNNNTTMKSSINVDLISHLLKGIHTLKNIN